MATSNSTTKKTSKSSRSTKRSKSSNGAENGAKKSGGGSRKGQSSKPSAGTTKSTDLLPKFNWNEVAHTLLVSRELDRVEEEALVPEGLITYQFSSRGHDLAQIILGMFVGDSDRGNTNDAATVYYRSRPFLLTQGLRLGEALMSTMGREGGINRGRDIGVVHNLPRRERGTVLPTSGDVGAQYTPAIGWAQAARYRTDVLDESAWNGALGVALGGDASCATNGFWSALVIATTLKLPYIFFVEDNGYGISVTGDLQSPGSDISANLEAFGNLKIMKGDGTDPAEVVRIVAEGTEHARSGEGPVLMHLTVPRLSGHSFADNQAYKSEELVAEEEANDPLPKLKAFLIEEKILTEKEWDATEEQAIAEVTAAVEEARAAGNPSSGDILAGRFYESGTPQTQGGELAEIGEESFAAKHGGSTEATPSGPRMNLVDAVRTTLAAELERNDRVLVFGEDVGMKGGVHGATIDLQSRFGSDRVFDTSLNEEGIIGRSVGMAAAGLMPIPEIQFRKYADPAHEQIADAGTLRWRTDNRFAVPMVVRIPVGFGKHTGDPWHSVSGEALYAHLVGWRIAFPSNAEDAVGLLRSAMRGNDPTMFFEHRALLDTRDGRRPWPGDDFLVEFGKGKIVREGSAATIVSWGALLHRAVEAVEKSGIDAEIIDLRTIIPWDREMVLDSVAKTHRCLVLHEDGRTCGFGAEIAATIAQDSFRNLDAPVERLTTPDVPIPYNPHLMDAVVPTVDVIAERLEHLVRF